MSGLVQFPSQREAQRRAIARERRDAVLAAPEKPGAVSIRGDISITIGLAGQSIIVQAFDLEGIPQERREIAVAYYDQNEIDRFGAWWRALMARRTDVRTEPRRSIHSEPRAPGSERV